MNTIDIIWENYQEKKFDEPDPPDIERSYRMFREAIRNLSGRDAARIWDLMTICQSRAAERAFKDGYKLGYRFRKEMEGEE